MESNQRLITRQEDMYGKIQDYLSREIAQKQYCRIQPVDYMSTLTCNDLIHFRSFPIYRQ
jgi:hypothetical protein